MCSHCASLALLSTPRAGFVRPELRFSVPPAQMSIQLKYSENFVDNLVNEQFLTKLALETVSVPNICIQECMV